MKKTNRKGQVTIFIIIGIIIVAGVSLFFILREDTGIQENDQIEVDSKIEPVYSYIDNCLEDSSREVIYKVGAGGGYYDVNKEYSTGVLGSTYYIKDNKNVMPSKKEIEEEISSNVETQLKNCSSDINDEFEDFDIETKEPSLKTSIEESRIFLECTFPLKIEKDGSKYEVEEFKKVIPIEMGKIYEAVEILVDEELKHLDGGIGVSEMSDIYDKYNLGFEVFQIDSKGDEFVFFVTEPPEEVNNETFVYSFAISY